MSLPFSADYRIHSHIYIVSFHFDATPSTVYRLPSIVVADQLVRDSLGVSLPLASLLGGISQLVDNLRVAKPANHQVTKSPNPQIASLPNPKSCSTPHSNRVPTCACMYLQSMCREEAYSTRVLVVAYISIHEIPCSPVSYRILSRLA